MTGYIRFKTFYKFFVNLLYKILTFIFEIALSFRNGEMAPFGRQHPTKQKGPGGIGTGRKKKLFIRRGCALIGLWAPSLGKDAACGCVSAASRDSLDAIPIRSLYIFERLSTFQFGCLVI